MFLFVDSQVCTPGCRSLRSLLPWGRLSRSARVLPTTPHDAAVACRLLRNCELMVSRSRTPIKPTLSRAKSPWSRIDGSVRPRLRHGSTFLTAPSLFLSHWSRMRWHPSKHPLEVCPDRRVSVSAAAWYNAWPRLRNSRGCPCAVPFKVRSVLTGRGRPPSLFGDREGADAMLKAAMWKRTERHRLPIKRRVFPAYPMSPAFRIDVPVRMTGFIVVGSARGYHSSDSGMTMSSVIYHATLTLPLTNRLRSKTVPVLSM